MSFTLHGLAVSNGIAIGHAHLVSHAVLEVEHYVLPGRYVDEEVARFDQAVAAVRGELDGLMAGVAAAAPSELTAFIDVHQMLLADPLLVEATRALIRSRRCNAEWALVQQMEQAVGQFEQIEDEYLRERKADVVQVVERVLKVLMGRPGHPPKHGRGEQLIVVAHDLSPADTIQFKQLKIGGFVTDLGGATSHTAIVARSLAIPAVVGLHHARDLIREDDMLIVDGTRGVLIVDPDARVLEEYRLRKSALELERAKLRRLKKARAATLDGEQIALAANIELPGDVAQARAAGAAGVGLFRTEFLFLNRDGMPGEEEQYQAYRSVAEAMEGGPVVIRTLDIGADKNLRGVERLEANPALGQRAIRYCLAEPQLFLTQLRAILRASAHGRVKVLVPMLAHAHEIDQTLALVGQAKEQLRARGQAFDDGLEVGGMIEIPAAALALGVFLEKLDFLSIGTNDLIQYTLAIDRSDEAVAHLYDPLHPAVLRLIAHTIQAGRRAGLPVAVCGEMAGDPQLTRLLLGMGLTQFSMHPAQILEVKQEVLRSNLAELRRKVLRLLAVDDPVRLRQKLERLNAI
ncbi:MAG: Phosphoenolpyruvate-protein phosphotransferase [Rhodocyclaceae bacterium]|nr:MAG: phosphoenolpyruvate--protein phosphotransferase [Rhodocyclaceae bacterium]MBE7423194.1 phosphoenolpyruvate--protein phosphotransferase [Zoogloeaceae bacterium]MBV6406727.1 Phosphoenolpyruvate-protein phosphotransferase [Rhodocyclaceae bacterium]MCK6384609.1 phosphoenolpyruvate--protein phosphotransferase [Rhodocyclaceae bacterium]CAG0930995.1 Phosphoenolpyruvate-protein phosphotransferase [Rhodocyclaceae bacterium]